MNIFIFGVALKDWTLKIDDTEFHLEYMITYFKKLFLFSHFYLSFLTKQCVLSYYCWLGVSHIGNFDSYQTLTTKSGWRYQDTQDWVYSGPNCWASNPK